MLATVTRPTIATSVCTVRDGHALIETGYTNTSITGAGGGVTASYPQALLRAGIGRAAEFDFAPPSYNRSSVGGALAQGSSDISFGFKWLLGENSKGLWGVNAIVSAPTGDPGFTAGATQYTGNVNWSYSLNSTWSAGGTIGFNSFGGTNPAGAVQQYSAFIPSLVLTASLPNASQVFGEYAYFSHAGPGIGSKNIIDAGYARDFGDHIQIDVEYGFQPTPVNGQKLHYVGAGISFLR